MSSELEKAKADLKTSEAAGDKLREHILPVEKRRDALEKLVDGLEADVARLEAEGLKPLVDRLRSQITSIRKLIVAMAIAIDELSGDALADEAAEVIDKTVEAVEDATK